MGVIREGVDAHCDTNEGLQAGGPPTVQLGQQRCFCLGLPPPQTSLSGQDSISKLQNMGSIQPPVQAWLSVFVSTQTHMHTYTVTRTCAHWAHMHAFIHSHSLTYTTPLINPQITQPIITTLVLIRNYLKHFPIRVYMLSWAGVCLDKPTGFLVGGKTGSSFIHTCMYARTHTHTRFWIWLW